MLKQVLVDCLLDTCPANFCLSIVCLFVTSLAHVILRKKQAKRFCRLGHGQEATPGKADTPGYDLRTNAALIQDSRGFRKLELPRNHNRVIQSSLDLLQGWRANCDVQPILYESHPDHPDPSDIAKVTDYVVAYACKGNTSLAEEKTQIKSTIMA